MQILAAADMHKSVSRCAHQHKLTAAGINKAGAIKPIVQTKHAGARPWFLARTPKPSLAHAVTFLKDRRR